MPLCPRGPQKVSGALVDARQVDSWHLATSLTTLSPPRSLGPSLVWAPEEPGTQGAVYGRGKLWSPCSSTNMQPHILVRLEHHAHSLPPQDLALRLPLPADPRPGSTCTQSLSPGPRSELFLPWARTTWPPSPPGDTAVLLPGSPWWLSGLSCWLISSLPLLRLIKSRGTRPWSVWSPPLSSVLEHCVNVFRRKMQGQVGRSSAWAAASTPDILSCPSLPLAVWPRGRKASVKQSGSQGHLLQINSFTCW